MGRGESWAFARLAAETRISVGGELLLWEPLVLENSVSEGQGPEQGVRERMEGFECLCLVVLVGPRVAAAIQAVSRTQGRPSFQQRVAAKGGGGSGGGERPWLDDQWCITSLCRLLEGPQETTGNGLALKVAGRATEDVAGLLAALLGPLEPVVGLSPYARR